MGTGYGYGYGKKSKFKYEKGTGTGALSPVGTEKVTGTDYFNFQQYGYGYG